LVRLRSREGSMIPCEVLAVPVRNPAGETVQVLYILKKPQQVGATAPMVAQDSA
jgi:hypothetical protein